MAKKKGGGRKTGKAGGKKKAQKTQETKQEVARVVEKGDFILINYIGEVRDTGEVFDTTLEEKAKEAGIYRENERYKPILVVVGEKWILEGVDEALVGKREGEEFTVEVPPEKGFGVRDSRKIVTTTIKKLQRAGYEGEIAPGVVLNIDGRPAIVRAVAGGRVMLDFNPPLAGKVLKYWVKIEKILKDRGEKISALIERHLGDNASEIDVREEDGAVILDMKDLALKEPRLHLEKKGVGDDILRYIEGVEEVRFIDRVAKEAKEETQAEPQQE